MNTIPFTYLLYCKPTGQYYYGSRYSKNCHPSQLWNTYFTSSKKIKQLIETYGKDSFEFQIRKTFDTQQQAREWEYRFLSKVKAAQSNKWINQHNGDKDFHTIGPQSEETKQKRRMSNLGKKRPPFTEEHRRKLSESARGRKLSDIHKQKMSETRKGVPKSDEHKSKLAMVVKVECPHCGKVGQKLNMFRHHFDKCKSIVFDTV